MKPLAIINFKEIILDKLCYTELVYGRINKKLKLNLTNVQIEEMITEVISETDENDFQKMGKNIYITNIERNVRFTINSHTYRIITADKISCKISNAAK